MKEILLTQGYVTLVDDEDYEYLSQFRWWSLVTKNGVYAYRNIYIGDRRCRQIAMHRELISSGRGLATDHKNGNKLDNQKHNLRECSTRQNNQAFRRKKCFVAGRTPTSDYRGVYWDKQLQKWRTQITYNDKRIHIGLFGLEEDAARAYDVAAKQYFGDFAQLNFPA